MGQSLNVKLRGLYTFPNDFSAVPEGALSVADNIVIDRDSIAEPRRGFGYLASTAGIANFIDGGDRCQKIFFYRDLIFAVVKTGSTYSLVRFDPTSGWVSCAASFPPPSSTVKSRAAFASSNMYITSDIGVARIDSPTSAPIRCGVPESYDIIYAAALSDANGSWLASFYSVNYREVWGFKDANGNLFLGSPSGIKTVYNGGLTGLTVNLELSIPKEVITGFSSNIFYFCQLYRSAQVAGDYPDDELRLVAEIFPDAGDIAAEKIVFEDLTTEALRRGASLYTNASQGGIGASNFIPPKALDIAVYRDCLFYANIKEQHTFYLTLLGVGNLSNGDTIVIGGDTYTADTGASPLAAFHFGLEKMGLTESINITVTARELVRAINESQSAYYAKYITGVDDLPGKIMIREEGIGGAGFALTTANPLPWFPALPATGTAQSSTDSYAPNGLACSKPMEPESVPVSYRWPVGSKDSAILRILPLRDSLFILKEDGVYRLWGSDPSNFQIALLDSTANCIAPDSAVVMNNQIFALTTQGVVTISETGVTIMSRPIENDILKLLTVNPTVLVEQSFAVAYETQRAYYLWLPTISTNTYPTQYYRYNTITNNWTRGTLAKACGGVNPYDDKLYLGDPVRNFLDQEKKTNTSFDYADYVSTNAISAVSGKIVTIAGASSLIAGQILYVLPAYATKTGATGAGGVFDETNNEITINGHLFVTGLKIALSINSGALPAGLPAGTYFVIKTGANTFKLAFTYALAVAGTAVDFTDKGDTGKLATFNPSETAIWGTIESVSSTTVTMAYPVYFPYTTVLVLEPIHCAMKWTPCIFGNPGINKQVREASLLFLCDFYGDGEVSFETDISPTVLAEDVHGCIAAPWGRFPWGVAPWGMGAIPRRRPLRVMVPRIHQRASLIVVGFNHAVGFSPWALQGISLIGNNLSEKVWMEGSTVE